MQFLIFGDYILGGMMADGSNEKMGVFFSQLLRLSVHSGLFSAFCDHDIIMAKLQKWGSNKSSTKLWRRGRQTLS